MSGPYASSCLGSRDRAPAKTMAPWQSPQTRAEAALDRCPWLIQPMSRICFLCPRAVESHPGAGAGKAWSRLLGQLARSGAQAGEKPGEGAAFMP